MKKSRFIDSVRVNEPCNEDWNKMAGNEKVRFCSHCSRHVNNISEMTPRKAAKLVMRSNGNLASATESIRLQTVLSLLRSS